jgi:hypothetical protein
LDLTMFVCCCVGGRLLLHDALTTGAGKTKTCKALPCASLK